MKKLVLSSVLLLSVLTLSGCESLKEQMGLNRRTPDEFAVMQRAPLEIPSDFSSLPVPQPGMQRPQDVSAVVQAKEAIVGDASLENDITSRGEMVLLEKIGTQKALPNIRQILLADYAKAGESKLPVVKKVLGLSGDAEKEATLVDAEAEARRILDAKKNGQSVTAGETPTVKE